MAQTTPFPILAGKRILIVEDEVLLAIELEDKLEAVGAFPMESVPDVPHALEAVRSWDHIDAALINVWLRGELSFPVAEELRRRGIPFAFVTGSEHDLTQH